MVCDLDSLAMLAHHSICVGSFAQLPESVTLTRPLYLTSLEPRLRQHLLYRCVLAMLRGIIVLQAVIGR